jgi:hypothetical protein
MSSLTWFLKLRGSTGVGFAQPNGGNPSTIRISGMMMVPKGSIWTMGLSEMRPSIFAVGSPSRFAIQACADSCTQIANKRTITWKKMSTGFACANIGFCFRYYHEKNRDLLRDHGRAAACWQVALKEIQIM